MAEYLIQDTTLAELADSARVITGETKELSPAEIKEQLVIAEEAIDTQANLLAQLSAILDGKAAGGGNGGTSTPLETCTVTMGYQKNSNLVYTAVENGEAVLKTVFLPIDANNSTLISLNIDLSKVLKGSYLIFGNSTTTAVLNPPSYSGDVELIQNNSGFTIGAIFRVNGDCTISLT